jgi:amino acid transporter
VVGSMLMGAALYLLLEVTFIGALNPHNLIHGWANPFGSAGSFGPYYTLATSVGLGWLGVVLIIDALISPGGTGLVYLASTSRLSYSLARVRFLPPVFGAIDRRGVPWFSIVFGGVFGCFLFLPFGGWKQLVGAITAASSFMYSFAPVAAVSLRKSDPDRERPYKVAGLNVIAPFGFIVSGLIIYWSDTTNIVKLDIAVLFFLVLYFVARQLDPAQAPIDFRAGFWMVPWIVGLTIFSIFGGSYVGGYSSVFGIHIGAHLPFWWDIAGVAVYSLIIFYYAVNSRLSPERTNANVLEAVADAHQEDLDLGIGEPA